MEVREVPPGTSLEDYRKRAELVLRLAGEYDFVYVHLKGPDEPGHDGLYDLKKQRIEEIVGGSLKPDGSRRFTETSAGSGHFDRLERGSLLLPRLKQVAV